MMITGIRRAGEKTTITNAAILRLSRKAQDGSLSAIEGRFARSAHYRRLKGENK